MKVSTERITVQQAEDGNLLVTLEHTWTPEQSITVTVSVPMGNWTLQQLREQAVKEVQRRLALPASRTA